MSKLLLRGAAEENTPKADPPPYSTPRWVKVFGIITLALVLLLVIIMFTGVGGKHGPGRHMQSEDAGGYTPSIEHDMQQP